MSNGLGSDPASLSSGALLWTHLTRVGRQWTLSPKSRAPDPDSGQWTHLPNPLVSASLLPFPAVGIRWTSRNFLGIGDGRILSPNSRLNDAAAASAVSSSLKANREKIRVITKFVVCDNNDNENSFRPRLSLSSILETFDFH